MKKLLFILFILATVSCNKQTTSGKNTELPDEAPAMLLSADASKSLFQLKDKFVNQNGDTLLLSDLKGKPLIASMIFTTCKGACPRLVADIRKIEKDLGDKKDEVRFLLVSFDSEYDDPSVLKDYADRHHLGENWTLLQGTESSVRTLSVLLDVPFQQTGPRLFSHENKISVLDSQGILRYQQEGLGNSPENINSALNQLLTK